MSEDSRRHEAGRDLDTETRQTKGKSRSQQLAPVFVELADTLVADFDLIDFLHLLAERSVALLGVDAAGLMLSDQRGQLRVLSSTSEQSRLLELFELQNAEGPCLDSFRTGQQVVNVDPSEAQRRWPVFTPEALAAGFSSVHALPLRLRGTVIGAINLFCVDAVRLSAEDLDVGQALADVATIGLLSNRTAHVDSTIAANLQAVLSNRVVIEQAKGVLAEKRNLDMEQAFRLIRNYAHDNALKLTAVATDVVEGSLPDLSLSTDSVRKDR